MTNPRKMLHLACVAPPEVGGIGTAALREVDALRARGYEAVLAAPERIEGEADVTRPAGVRVMKPRWRVGNAAALPLDALLRESWDVIHVHYPFYGTAEQLLTIPRSVPIVMTFHMDAVMGGWREPIARIHRWIMQPWILRRMARICVSSLDYAADASIAALVQKNDPRVVELPFGIDLSLFTPGPSERSRFDLPEGKTIFLMVGGLDRPHLFKGVPIALRALAQLKDPHVMLALRGDGDLKPSFQELAATLGIADRVRFLPRCDAQDLPRLYRSADALLLPSTSRAEAFGLVAIESQACGTPVIASDLPGVRSVLADGRTGWLVPPGDVDALAKRMKDYHEDLSIREVFSKEAVLRARARYDEKTHTDRLIQLYEEVCASPS